MKLSSVSKWIMFYILRARKCIMIDWVTWVNIYLQYNEANCNHSNMRTFRVIVGRMREEEFTWHWYCASTCWLKKRAFENNRVGCTTRITYEMNISFGLFFFWFFCTGENSIPCVNSIIFLRNENILNIQYILKFSKKDHFVDKHLSRYLLPLFCRRPAKQQRVCSGLMVM